MPDWDKFSLSRPTLSDRGDLLKKVTHIAHVSDAQRIIETGELKAELVNEQSKLASHRIAVVWTSANHWHHGSFYGNVRFEIDRLSIASGKRFYWVETLTRSEMPSYRVLVTDADHGDISDLHAYEPKCDDGPIVEHGGNWYWNSNAISEIVIEGNIELSSVSAISTVNHNNRTCVTYGRNCRDFSKTPNVAAAEMLAYILAERKLGPLSLMVSDVDSKNQLSPSWEAGFSHLSIVLGGIDSDKFSGYATTPEQIAAATRGALMLYARNMRKDSMLLARTLPSPEDLQRELTRRLVDLFGSWLDNFEPPPWAQTTG